MKRLSRILGILAILGALIACGGDATAQTPWNRELQTLAVLPDSAGGYSVLALWTVDVEATSTPLDLSTNAILQINGTAVATQSFSVGIDPGSGLGCGTGPPCIGSCGSGTLDGAAMTLLCYEDGPCSPAFCDCDCGAWILADFGSEPLMPEDEIMVILMPAPGALPDTDTSDDAAQTTFHDQPIGWNRGIHAVNLVETGPGLFDIQVPGFVAWESPSPYLNLDFTVELFVNGSLVSSQNIPAAVEGILDQPCWESGCGSACGTMNGIPRYCDPHLWWACACLGGWLSNFPGVPLVPGDEIMVLLRPAPGALPELPGLEDDDLDILNCCSTAAVEDAGELQRRWQLEQNRPNPFSPMSSITFDLAEGGAARVQVFDADGRRVKTLLERNLGAGRWSITWDGRTEAGALAPSGTYFYELSLNGRSETRKMTLLR
jgi:hypothetical protein